ncbi:SigE family RNA polymerase sigma factor [Nocardioides sp. SOB77]|uniref:SigE family RNA polymerase sigma factor n=1 Tax=Nocardioides oceani TaxID=3058369 RepID=A0ABT8FFU0_9ACTN|nr:SigE family RNA polymerase sigma factor [Nocardioides oceani]MDN4173280.1 SigE family RNA polymerase sigma factor [Nocardioides oceani]
MDEAELLGFTEWMVGCERALLRSAYLLTGDLHRAQDLVQEALVKVALRWPRLRDGDPLAYARRVVARDHVSWWRRRRRETGMAEVPEVPGTPGAHGRGTAASSDPETALVVQRALARLTPAQRAVLVLRHFDDLTERQTAEVLGVSTGTVKSQNAAALARLRTGAPELLDLIGETR